MDPAASAPDVIATRVDAEHPGAMAGAPVDWAGLRRVLVVRPDNLGDVLLAGPALRALRAAAPAAALDLLASPAGAPAAALLPEVDGVLVASPTWQLAGPPPPPDPAAELALVERLRAGRYDAAVVLTSFSQSPWPAASLLHLARVPVRVGLSKEFGGALLTHWVPSPPDGLHQVDRALHLLARVGVPGAGTDLHAVVPPSATAPRPGSAYAVVLPGASCSSRRWAPERFAELVGALLGRGLGVVVAGSAREAGLVEQVCAGGAAVPLAGVLDVAGLAALLQDAAVAVVNNSGGMHLADALRVPQVVLFAGTELEEQYAPRSGPSVVLRRPTACAPCRTFTCPYRHECLDVEAGTVADAALSLLPARAA